MAVFTGKSVAQGSPGATRPPVEASCTACASGPSSRASICAGAPTCCRAAATWAARGPSSLRARHDVRGDRRPQRHRWPAGFDVDHVLAHVQKNGCLAGLEDEDPESTRRAACAADFFAQPCTCVVPAALELQLTEEVARRMQCDAVFEAANGPTTREAELLLHQAGVQVFPDVLCNAGGVIVSYCEWLQNKHHRWWSEDEVNHFLEERMGHTFDRVLSAAGAARTTLRTACFAIAVDAVDAMLQLDAS